MVCFFKYSIPFSTPLQNSKGILNNREGIILSFENDGITAFGEVSPLPGFSKESLPQVEQVLLHNRKFLNEAFSSGDPETIISVLDSIHQFPSLSFGLDVLHADLSSKKEGKSLHEFLFNKTFEKVPCNFALGINQPDALLDQVQKVLSKGFRTIKLKVGKNLDSELNALKLIRKHHPEINIRIDANQAWKTEEAIQNLDMLTDLNIEYCEQPVSASNPEDLRLVTNKSGIPIAADESVRDLQDVKKLIDNNACKIMILKPMLFGRIKDLIVTKQLAITHNIEVVLTTSFEGIIGRTATAILASGLGSKKLAHGLATGIYLNEGDSREAEIEEGFYRVSKQAGLGSPVDLKYLEEIS